MKKFFLITALVFFYVSIFSQSISGKINIEEAPQLNACAQVHIYFKNLKKDTLIFTDQEGRFQIQLADTGVFNLRVYQQFYSLTRAIKDTLRYDDLYYDLELYSYESLRDSIEDYAAANSFDMGFSIQPAHIATSESDAHFKGVLSTGINYSVKYKLAKSMQFGFNYSPITINYYFLDKTKYNLKDETIKSLTYNYTSTSLFVFTRYFILKKNKSDLGFYIDLGIGYQLPYSFTFNTFYPNSKRLSVRNIHHFNDFQLMFKMGYQYLNVKINYRLVDDMLKDEYTELPRLMIGVEASLPTVTRQY